MKRLNEIADSAGFKLLDVNDYAKGLAEPTKNRLIISMGDPIITETKTMRSHQMTRQTERLNMILAFAFGVVFIAAILALIVLIPHPSPVQYHFFTIIIALAAGGVATVISGMLNVRVSFGLRFRRPWET